MLDTMVVSALVHPNPSNPRAIAYRQLIQGQLTVISFVVVTELRYGALKASWGELRRRALERDLRQFMVVQRDDELMRRVSEVEGPA